ncbi:heterokaryon incompatibility protein-domain-containing protein [Apodospora peruviana]|uniref:Heterokaryon incompatibility protein-domain-containing protein n=1 Tax=Apodospora peruviana TaxID=516989 RepID=A0AAE0I206_9PEZI|nr:heterokaryon incompatibility protein-domain-containing protein [Apodospora peruviana]
MWLINTTTRELEYFVNPDKGSYAILSHTWGDGEVSFQEYRAREEFQHKEGMDKINMTCVLASAWGLQYAWVDTCCIDKQSSAELSEAINSMFQWYKGSAVCFAYLSDLSHNVDFQDSAGFPACNWLKRGWTLQELIAPEHVEFYDQAWTKRGTKIENEGFIAETTRIDGKVLRDSAVLSLTPVAKRMFWASARKTTRIEDLAYCLMGIFDIHMPMIYGEGSKSFMRLQEEIAKQSCDRSLFAWTAQPLAGEGNQAFRGMFARSPAEFSSCSRIRSRHSMGAFEGLIQKEFTITNKGVGIKTMLVGTSATGDSIFNLGLTEDLLPRITDTRGWIGIYLTKTPLGFVRSRSSERYTAGADQRTVLDKKIIHIRKDVSPSESASLWAFCWRWAVHLRPFAYGELADMAVMPTELWDRQRRLFLDQGSGINSYALLKFAAQPGIHRQFRAVVACSTMNCRLCSVWTEQDRLFRDVCDHLEHRTELSDYVAVDYLRVYFCRELPGDTTECTARFHDDQTGYQIVVSVKLTIDQYNGAHGYFLSVQKQVLHVDRMVS